MGKRLNKRNRRRRSSSRSFRSGNAGPILKLLGVVFGALAGLALLVFGVMFVLEAFFKVDTPLDASGIIGKFAGKINTPLIETPSPVPTVEPTPTPHPMEGFDPAAAQRELILPGELNYPWLADPSSYGSTVILSAGRLADGKVKLERLVSYDIATGSASELEVKPENDHLLHPVFNDKWLVYFDANYDFGGGAIRCIDRTASSASPRTIKTVYVGQPELRLENDILTWIERTGSEREKIFVCDLSSGETAVTAYFDNQASGTSMPFIHGNKLVWASPASMSDSAVKTMDIGTGSVSEFRPGVFVHDPEYNGEYYAWLDSTHGENAKLYLSDGVSGSIEIAEGVVEFGIDEDFIAYSKGLAVYMYVFDTGETYCLTANREAAQLLGVSGGVIFFMDVTSRERDIIKYMVSPFAGELRSVNEG
ncbi:MAG: hypothetical protein IKI64_10940 [Clostridia bacterium]|nr:hypothetical protein [Clostridia bacterium]